MDSTEIDAVPWSEREKQGGFSWDQWRERISIMANMLDVDISSVLDLGAGGMLLKEYLPHTVAYYPVDCKSRCDETIVCDFNQHQFPNLQVDAVFVNECLEYIEDVEWFLDNVTRSCSKEIILSYNPIEFTPDLSIRRNSLWINDISTIALVQMFQKRGFLLINEQDYCRNEHTHQLLYRFKKSAPNLLPYYKFCTGCGTCSSVCPTEALVMQPDKDGFLHPVFNSQKCVNCSKCVETCPSLHPIYKNRKEPDCFAVWADDEIREQSSSGGAFSLFANEILRRGGYVCGAAWTEKFRVQHILIHDAEELSRLRHSKYMQSDLCNNNRDIKALLDRDETVLFSGCPCQVAGLYALLGKEYEKLFTVDLLCSHVPSPLIFEKYLQENFDVSNLASFEFRSKRNGWNWHTQLITMKDGREILRDINNDLFENGYHPRLYMNTVCEYCQYANFPRQGDITIGDSWWCKFSNSEFDDNQGTSTVLVNSDKGALLFEKIQSICKLCESVPLENVKSNRINQHFAAHPARDRFADLIQRMPFNNAVDYALNNKYDVAVVGPWSGVNYGANLTYFALYKTLCAMGLETMMVERPRSLAFGPNEMPQRYIRNPFCKYDMFILNNDLEMRTLNDKCKTFILGSDQMWNENLAKHWKDFTYLGFVKDCNKKIAYATSFGQNDYYGPEESRSRMSYFLNKFDFVSVREDSGVDICKNKFGVSASRTIDPVFLCDIKEYEKLARLSTIKDENFIAAYLLDPTDQKQKACQYVSEKSGCKLVNLPDAFLTDEIRRAWYLDIKDDYTTEDWLCAIKNSRFVITDSFHGVCFSIIFKRPFVAIANKERGIPRFTSLLQHLGLMDRMVSDAKEIQEKSYLLESVDYKKVYSLLEIEKAQSLKWLKDAVFTPLAKKQSTFDIMNDRADVIETRLNTVDEYTKNVNQRFQGIDEYAKSVNQRFQGIDEYARNADKRFCDIYSFDEQVHQSFAVADESAKRMNQIVGAILIQEQEKEQRLMLLEHQIQTLFHSRSYRLGRMLTYLPRKVRDVIQRIFT